MSAFRLQPFVMTSSERVSRMRRTMNTLLFFLIAWIPRVSADPGCIVGSLLVPDTSRVVVLDAGAKAGVLGKWLRGDGNRLAWTTPVELPVLDLEDDDLEIAPGIDPYGRTALLARRPDGVVVRIRPVANLISDERNVMGSIHPFAETVVSVLAEGAGISGVASQAVFLHGATSLGNDRTEGGPAILSGWPYDGDQFVTTDSLYQLLRSDSRVSVDERAYLRERLFDWLVGDWDQPETQWIWRADSLGGRLVFRPVALDRTFALSKLDGAVFDIERLSGPAGRRFQTFSPDKGFLAGFTRSGIAGDRRFTASLTREDWSDAASELMERVDDNLLSAALRVLPRPLDSLEGPTMLNTFKARRSLLPEVATEFFLLTSRVVDVVGTDKADYFEVLRLEGGETLVNVFSGSDRGSPLFRRRFNSIETNEIRFFGLDGDDTFFLSGLADLGPTLVLSGGAGNDAYTDLSRVQSLAPQVICFDTIENSEFEGSGRMRIRPTESPVEYSPDLYTRSYSLPLAYFGYNNDDGAFVGGGVEFIRTAFRKVPYVASHKISANLALRTFGFNAIYAGRFPKRIGRWDALVQGQYLSPKNIQNYFRLGNETDDDEATANYYSARISRVRVATSAWFETDHLDIQAGPFFEHFGVDVDPDLAGPPVVQPGVLDDTFRNRWFGGVDLAVTLRNLDNRYNPRSGLVFFSETTFRQGLTELSDRFSTIATSFAGFVTPSSLPWVTVAARVGADHILGDFPFYEARYLGEFRNLRGYRRRRFRGRSVFFGNAELRFRLAKSWPSLRIYESGPLVFFDAGRVWTDAETSTVWHHGYGAGLWAQVAPNTVLMAALGFSPENQGWLTIKTSFQF